MLGLRKKDPNQAFTHAPGRGAPSDGSRLERELEVALPNCNITIDLSEVEELGAEGSKR